MKIEIAHDILARSVFQRSSEEERLRLRVQSFVKQRYEYYKWKGALLTIEDIRYIEPLYELLDLSAKEKAFVEKSEKHLAQKERRQQFRQILYVALPVLATGMFFMGFQFSQAQEYQLQATVVKDSVEILKTEVKLKEQVAEKAQEQVEVLEKKAKEQASFLEENKDKLSDSQKEQMPTHVVELNSRKVKLVQEEGEPEEELTERQKERQKRREERQERLEETKQKLQEENQEATEGVNRFEENLKKGSQDLKNFFKNRKKRNQEQEAQEAQEPTTEEEGDG